MPANAQVRVAIGKVSRGTKGAAYRSEIDKAMKAVDKKKKRMKNAKYAM